MCGINGIISRDTQTKQNISHLNKLLSHRGPDDEGFVFIDPKNNSFTQLSGDDTIPELKSKYPSISNADYTNYEVILGHRRLSIIDLTESGHGPMCDISGKLWVTYNGEIYNYIELREELKSYGYKFRTNSDTEVILYSYDKWGKDCLNHFNGMWAFALWDGNNKELFLARDRFGVKPLYFTQTNNYFAFSSEIKPLLSLKQNDIQFNTEKIPFFVLYGNRLNSEETYIKNIHSLRPSYFAVYKNGNLETKRYYDIPVTRQHKKEKNLKDELVELLSDSIKLRFRSDVPVGTCLSGGFDSSSIAALSSKLFSSRLQTFSAVWDEPECDESKYIDIVNTKFNCIENKIIPSAYEFEDTFTKMNYYQEIPTEGPGIYPQWFVMKKAKGNVKVLLDGQGGDEVFGGYFQKGTHLRSLIIDKKIGSLIKDISLFKEFMNKNGVHSFSSWLFPKLYSRVVRRFLTDSFKVINPDILKSLKSDLIKFDSAPPKKYKNYLNNLSYHFIKNMTIPTLLHYEDRSSMAHSIESRVPFLDFRLVEFGVNLSSEYLLDKSISRPLFRKALQPYLPKQVVERSDKLGYPVPFNKWTKTILKNYIKDNLSDSKSDIYAYIDYNYIQQKLNKHFSNEIDYAWDIWRLLSLKQFLYIGNTFKL